MHAQRMIMLIVLHPRIPLQRSDIAGHLDEGRRKAVPQAMAQKRPMLLQDQLLSIHEMDGENDRPC